LVRGHSPEIVPSTQLAAFVANPVVCDTEFFDPEVSYANIITNSSTKSKNP